MPRQDRLLLRPSKWKMGLFAALCLAFTLVGGLMIREDRPYGWFVTIMFGLGSLVFLVQLWPNSSYLLLEPDGFTVCSLFRTHKQAWADVEHFGITRISMNKMVAFDYASGYAKARTARQIASGLSGFEGALPDSYGMKPEQLAELMNSWKARSRGATYF